MIEHPQVKRCIRCVLPDNFPGVKFNEDGLCNHCQNSSSETSILSERQKLKEELDVLLRDLPDSDEYDCIVAFSGGKDSSYTLLSLVEDYNLNCLAVTIDNGFISPQAMENCYSVTKALGVDFSVFAPSPKFMNGMYKKSISSEGIHQKSAITRASQVCNSCINLINNHVTKLALQNGTSVIAGGYVGGQVPKGTSILKLDLRVQERMRAQRMEKYREHFGDQSDRFFSLPNHLIDKNPILTIINPMLAVSLTVDEIIEKISSLGWKRTSDTGKHSTNCRLNDLGISTHYKKYGFHPYVAEVAEQVRAGLEDRSKAIAKLESIPSIEEVSDQARQLGVSPNDIA